VRAGAAELPAWWTGFPSLPRLETAFVQESESAVFGKLTRRGQLRLAQGGRLRVDYQGGLLLVADGRSLIQFDPQARTAQRQDLRSAVLDAPLLNVLLNPGRLSAYYQVNPGADGTLQLEPRRPSLPKVELAGRGRMIQRIQWTDGTGARQRIEFQDPRVPAAFAPGVFSFQAPAGTRWLGHAGPESQGN
jgi:outer membrane lipoprotein-sorting protein